MDEEKNKDVNNEVKAEENLANETEKKKVKKKKENAVVKEGGNENTTTENNSSNDKKKKIIMFSVIGGLVVVALIIIIALVAGLSKPSKKDSEKLVKSYLEAINDKDGEALVDLIDTDGYIIFKEEGEKKFNDKYNDKSKYIKRYMDKKNYDDKEELEEKIADDFESTYKYQSYEYSLNKLSDIKKSSKSNKIVVIKAKVKVKSDYSNTTKTLRLYTTKVSGKYKIIGAEFV